MDYDAGDEKQVKSRKTKAELERERQLEELRTILSTEGGRYFLWRVLAVTGIFHSNSDPDTVRMAIKSGRRDVGLEIMHEIIQADEKAFNKMQIEGRERDGRQS